MIYPPLSCAGNYNVSERIQVCMKQVPTGTLFYLYHNVHNRPLKNGNLFLIDTDHKVVLFKNVNGYHVHKDKNGCIVIEEGAPVDVYKENKKRAFKKELFTNNDGPFRDPLEFAEFIRRGQQDE